MATRATEKLVQEIATMDRAKLVSMLHHLDCGFKIDFTDEFLSEMSLERLRHIALAAALQAGKPLRQASA